MSTRPLNSALAASLLLVSLLLSASSVKSQAQALPETTFAETIDVGLVNVEVWVSDREGNPVSGLGREAFTILHDGNTVSIDHFSGIRDLVPADATTIDGPANQSMALQPHVVVVFDLLGLTSATQKRLARELRTFLENGQIAAEQVMILRLERYLSIEVPFGSTADALKEALKGLEKRRTSSANLSADLKQVVQAMQGIWTDLNSPANTSSIRSRVNLVIGPTTSQGASATSGGTGGATGSGGVSTGVACEDFVDRVEPIVVSWAQKELSRTLATLDRLGDASAFLSGLDGPKMLLYLSDGLGMAPGASATGFVRGLCPAYKTDLEVDALPEEISPSFLQLTRRVNANQITFHAIQGSSIEGTLGGAIGDSSSDRRGVRGFERSLSSAGRQGLTLLAEETGGRVLAGSTDLDDQLGRLGEEMGSYYSLAYTPPPGDVRDHQIEVSVTPESLRARHRRSYSEKTPDQWLTERLESALYLGLVANPLAIRLGAGTITPTEGSRHTLPLHIMVPAERLAFVDNGSSSTSQITIKVMALNTESRTLVMTDRNMILPSPESGDGEVMDLRVNIELEGGVQVVAIAVRDRASGEASFVSTTMHIGTSES